MDIANNLYGWIYKENQNNLTQLSENQILTLAENINQVFSDKEPRLTLPRLVVLGTQSSGKSSVLNSIMSMEILPTGKNMVTRTPLDIRLIKIKDTSSGWFEFGQYIDNIWKLDQKINVKTPAPLPDEISAIREYIKKETIRIAGSGMDISFTPIHVRIYASALPNLSLIDLPGLTMVACIDKGQPQNIKDKIEELVISYIKQPKTIVITVMQARTDLETDLGLALVKKYDCDGLRTIGVLTKPDLMNEGTNVSDYLMNNISKSLMLSHGYYVVKNKNEKDSESEKNYFINHPEYKKTVYKERIGVPNLTASLNRILINSIVEMLPSIMSEINTYEKEIILKLREFGQGVPKTKEAKFSLINRYITNFYYDLNNSIESKHDQINTGRLLKEVFTIFKDKLAIIQPFVDKTKYNDAYFKNIAANFEGNHMVFMVPPIQILEATMNDKVLNPLYMLKPDALDCSDEIVKVMNESTKSLIQQSGYKIYPDLAQHILTVTDDLLNELNQKCKKYILDLIDCECKYIWTDSADFKNALASISKNSKFETENIITMLTSYYNCIKENIAHNIPKVIMSFVIRELQESLFTYLFDKTIKVDKLPLLKEDNDVEAKRIFYSDMLARIDKIKKSYNMA